MTGNGSQDYFSRNSANYNIAEDLFMEWAKRKCTYFARIGFDEKKSNISLFYHLNPIIRNLPDYIIKNNGRLFLVNVKGTSNIKEKEMKMLPKLIESFASEKVPLVYAFCFRDKEPQFIKTDKLIELYEAGIKKVWSDGVVYKTIKL